MAARLFAFRDHQKIKWGHAPASPVARLSRIKYRQRAACLSIIREMAVIIPDVTFFS